MKRLALILLVILVNFSFAQDINYIKKIIDTLDSPIFAGRAYCKGQDKLAANYLIKQFQKLHLQPLCPDYQQSFTLTKNCIFKSILIQNKDTLKLGIDYILYGATPSIQGTYKIKYIKDPQNWQKYYHKVDNKFIAIDYSKIKSDKKLQAIYQGNLLNAKGIIFLTDETYYYQPRLSQIPYPIIYVRKSAFKPKGKISLNIKSKVDTFETQNLCAYIKGRTDKFILFTAHYDHLGVLGDIYFPGANDNASGVATVLAIAKHFANRKTPPKYNLAFILFSGEELGLLGSSYFVNNLPIDKNKIKLVINLDLVGSGDKGITIVNGKENPQVVKLLNTINQQYQLLPQIKLRKNAPNSDHYPFTQEQIPAIFIYTLGNYKEYHNIFDKAENLPLSKTKELAQLLINFVERF